jgi:hypothetical protein
VNVLASLENVGGFETTGSVSKKGEKIEVTQMKSHVEM